MFEDEDEVLCPRCDAVMEQLHSTQGRLICRACGRVTVGRPPGVESGAGGGLPPFKA